MAQWKRYYQPADPSDWQGRKDTRPNEYFYQVVNLLGMAGIEAIAPGFAFIGFACDEGVRRNLGRPGAAEGPQALKKTLARLPIHHILTLYDAGTIVCKNDDLESAQRALAEVVDILIQHQLIPIVLGGGHETAWGHYQGLAKHYDDHALQIINFDAHFDLRDLPKTDYGTSGTPFRQIAQHRKEKQKLFNYACVGIQRYGNTDYLFQEADSLNVNYLMADQIHQEGYKLSNYFLTPFIEKAKHIYLSICLDVFAAHYAPGVSAPQVLGLSPHQILPSLRELASSGKVIALDIVEYAPKFDQDDRTAKLAAYLLSDFLHHCK